MRVEPLIGIGVFLLLRGQQFAGEVSTMISDPPGGYSANVRRFAEAIARAEGYGIAGAIPTRLNNPGNLKASSVPSIGSDANGHLHFATIEDGWRALYRQLQMIIDGKSRVYSMSMTISDMAKKYAGWSENWMRNVSSDLGVSINTKLEDVLG